MEVSGQLRIPVALPPGKSLQYPLDRRLSEPQNRSGRGGEEKNFLSILRIEPRSFSHSLVTVLTELSGLIVKEF
jgi:hypothetical protein